MAEVSRISNDEVKMRKEQMLFVVLHVHHKIFFYLLEFYIASVILIFMIVPTDYPILIKNAWVTVCTMYMDVPIIRIIRLKRRSRY